MSTYAIDGLKKEVRIVIDKNMTSTALAELGDVDTLSVDDIIESALPRAARLVLLDAPLYRIDTVTDAVTSGAPAVTMRKQGDGYVGVMRLPNDFMRAVCVRMSDWKRNGRMISEDDEEYDEQLSEYAGIRGNPSKPVAAIVQGEDGLYMELYSSKDENSSLLRFTYVAEPSVKDGGMVLPSKLKDAIVYEAASLAYEILGSKEQSDSLSRTSMVLAEIEQ